MCNKKQAATTANLLLEERFPVTIMTLVLIVQCIVIKHDVARFQRDLHEKTGDINDCVDAIRRNELKTKHKLQLHPMTSKSYYQHQCLRAEVHAVLTLEWICA